MAHKNKKSTGKYLLRITPENHQKLLAVSFEASIKSHRHISADQMVNHLIHKAARKPVLV